MTQKLSEKIRTGAKFGLAPKLFVDKKLQTYMVLHSTTGAIKELGQKALTEEK